MSESVSLAVYGIAQGSIYALIALGFSLIYRASGFLNLAFGEFVMFGSLVGYTALVTVGVTLPVALVGTLIIVGVAGFAIEKVIFLPIRRWGTSENALVASIGLLILLNQLGLIIWGAEALSYPPDAGSGTLSIGPAVIATQSLWIVALCALAVAALQWILFRTDFGIAMRAAAEDGVAAQLVGISPNRTAGQVAAISAGLGGLAGVMLGSLYFGSYTIDVIAIKGLAAATIGGFGDIRGAILGGLLLGVVESFGNANFGASISGNLAWVLMIAILLIWPQGILGVARRRDD